MTDEERKAHIAEACVNPEVQKFLHDMLTQMVGEDEEFWQALLEEAGSNVGQDGPEWMTAASEALNSVVELLYAGGETPTDLLNLVDGNV